MLDSDIHKRYELLSKVVLHESKAMWETSNLFLLSNTILASFIGSVLESERFDIFFLILPILGLLFSILWYFSYNRTTKYYMFRMAQIKQIEPKGFEIFSGVSAKVAEGEREKVDNKYYSVRVFGLNFRSLTIVNFIIVLFAAFFIYSFIVITLKFY